VDSLTIRERPASGQPQGLLILHHGRGTDESDLLPLADLLDPNRRLQIVTPRAPFELPGWPGYHWYPVHRVGYPDPESFWASFRQLAALHDELSRRYEVDHTRTVLGGFSMGAVMSYALGLGPDRPAPAGILALSGFIPTVEGWDAQLADRQDTRVFITHGRNDPVIDIGFARRAHELLIGADLDVEYSETEAAHHVDPASLGAANEWIKGVL
jgi:phospholipase/carboxylesterase